MGHYEENVHNSPLKHVEAEIDNVVKYRAVATGGSKRDVTRILTHLNSEALAEGFEIVENLFDQDKDVGEKTEIIVEITIRRVM